MSPSLHGGGTFPNPQDHSQTGEPAQTDVGHGVTLEGPAKLQAGDRLNISGQPFTFVPLRREDCALHIPEHLDSAERARFQTLFDALSEIRPHIQQISDRLQDPADGVTLRVARQLAMRLDDFPLNAQSEFRDYLAVLIRNGSALQYPRMCVIAPPFSAERLQAIVHHNMPDLFETRDFETFLDQIYSPLPLATGGYFLFSGAASEQNYHQAILRAQPQFVDRLERLGVLFAKMVAGTPLARAEVEEYDSISLDYVEAQRTFLEARLAESPEREQVEALSTRVTIAVDDEGRFSFTTEHYTQAFRAELDRVADIMRQAQLDLPQTAPDWKEMLGAYERWAGTVSVDPAWGESLTEWLKTSDSANVLDMNLCAEEIGSRVGKKGDFQFSLYQYAAIPPSLSGLWEGARQRSEAKGLRMVMLTQLCTAGHTMTSPVLGENLPNSAREFEGRPVQRTMTFDNVIDRGAYRANAENIRRALNFDASQVARYVGRRIPVLQTTVHEIGHTFDHEEDPPFLTSRRTHVAETDAEASALYLTALYCPDDVEDVARQVGCWMPCRRAMQGLGSPHSQSDLLMFEKYHAAGAVRVVESGSAAYLEVVDTEAMVDIAFGMALQTRMWQRGVPLDEQAQMLGDVRFDRNDPQQAERLMATVDATIAAMKSSGPDALRAWKERVNKEVEACYSLEHMREIRSVLDPVLASLEPSMPLLCLPGDPALERLAAFD